MMKIRIDDQALKRSLTDLQKRQLPFAMASAINSVARMVQASEANALQQAFASPTPFTMRAFGILPARKNTPVATVFAKDAQARYLLPYIEGGGGRQVLGKGKAILLPRDIAVNTYGNIPKNKLQALKGRPDVFVGTVHFKNGKAISGVWQRPKPPRRSVRRRAVGPAPSPKAGLKLLIQFTDPKPVKPRLPFGATAQIIVKKHLGSEVERALARALATAK